MTERSLVYAQALLELAVEEDKLEDIWQQLSVVRQVMDADEGFGTLLANPAIPKAERIQLVDTIFSQAQAEVRNFLKVLIDAGLVAWLKLCIGQFYKLYCEKMGILVVYADTAVELSSAQRDALCERLEKLTNKRIELNTKVNSSLIGGIRLRMDGKELESSIAARLNSISKTLSADML